MQWFGGSQHLPFHLEAGSAAVLLLHGFMGSPAELRPIGHALAEAGVSARAVALPGFGQDLARLGSVRRSEWVQAALDAWDSLEADYQRVALVGFSMGAAVALHVAARRRPERLVLIAPLWRLAGGDRRLVLLPLLKRLMPAIRPFARADFREPGLREFFGGARPDLDLDDPAVQAQLRREITLPTRTLDELRRLAGAAPQLAREVTMPTLIVQGKTDTVVHARDSRELATRFHAPVRLEEIQGDHLIVQENRPGWPEVRHLVVDFLSGAPS